MQIQLIDTQDEEKKDTEKNDKIKERQRYRQAKEVSDM